MESKEVVASGDVEEHSYSSSHGLAPVLAEWYYAIQMEGFTPGDGTNAELQCRRLLSYIKQTFGDDPNFRSNLAMHTPYRVYNRGRADDDRCFIMISTSIYKLEAFAQEDLLPMRVRARLGAGYQPFTINRKKQNVFSHPLQLVTRKLIDRLMGSQGEDPEEASCHTKRGDGTECGCNLFIKYQRQLMVRKRLEVILQRMCKDTEFVKGNGIDNAIKAGIVQKVFPLHMDRDKKSAEAKFYPTREQFLSDNCQIYNAWLTPWSFTSKSRKFVTWIRDYFGEKIGMYFAFLHFNCTAMFWLAIPGTALAAFQYTDQTYDNESVIIYAILVAFWATFYLEFWKRKSATWASRWDTLSFEEEEEERDEFAAGREKAYGFYEKSGAWVDLDEYAQKKIAQDEGAKAFIPLHAKDGLPRALRKFQYSTSIILILTLTCGVIAATLGLLTYKLAVGEPISAGVLNAISIFILDKIFFKVAIVLNNWENHRTTTIYEDSLILKVFFFQFVNAYTSLFYIAFYKGINTQGSEDQVKTLFGEEDPCPEDGCVNELSTQLTTIFITRLVIGNLTELVLPYVSAKFKTWRQVRDHVHETTASKVEKQALQTTYGKNQVPGTFFDYSELAIQFGYVVLFAPAFPLAPLLALGSNIVENATDAFKLIKETQKPTPKATADIGTWYHIFRFLAFLAVITNALFVAFTSTQLQEIFDNELNDFEKLLIVISAEHIILLLQIAVAYVIPDQPAWLRQQLAKTSSIQRIESEYADSRRLGKRVSIHEALVDLPDDELLANRVVWEAERYGTADDLYRGASSRKGSHASSVGNIHQIERPTPMGGGGGVDIELGDGVDVEPERPYPPPPSGIA